MTKEEAIEIMQILYATYPNFNKNDVKGFNAIWLKRLMTTEAALLLNFLTCHTRNISG